jgi:hypothetical protein
LANPSDPTYARGQVEHPRRAKVTSEHTARWWKGRADHLEWKLEGLEAECEALKVAIQKVRDAAEQGDLDFVMWTLDRALKPSEESEGE